MDPGVPGSTAPHCPINRGKMDRHAQCLCTNHTHACACTHTERHAEEAKEISSLMRLPLMRPFSAGTAEVWDKDHPLPVKDSQEGVIWQYSVPFCCPQELRFIIIG